MALRRYFALGSSRLPNRRDLAASTRVAAVCGDRCRRNLCLALFDCNNLVRRKAALALAAIAAFVVVAAAIIVPLLLKPGVPAYQHDWLWPADGTQCWSYAMLGMSPWLQNGTGTPAIYPQLWVPYSVSGVLCGIEPPEFGLCLLLLGITAIGSLGICYLCKALAAASPLGYALAILLFWGNPVVLNSRPHAGHVFFLWSYSLLPALMWLTLSRKRVRLCRDTLRGDSPGLSERATAILCHWSLTDGFSLDRHARARRRTLLRNCPGGRLGGYIAGLVPCRH